MLTAFGAAAVTFMMLMYALERRGRGFTLTFACGCLRSSAYGLAGVAFQRYRNTPPEQWLAS